jgi:ribosomal protein L37E
MAVVISGAEIIREYEGAYTNYVTYRRQCEACGYVPPTPPITAAYWSAGEVLYGTYHKGIFVCSFCGHLQKVEIQG